MNMQMTRCPIIDGKPFLTIEDAQKYALEKVVASVLDNRKIAVEAAQPITDALFDNREQIIEVLTLKPTSKPAARKANGATRKPRATKASAATGGTAA